MRDGDVTAPSTVGTRIPPDDRAGELRSYWRDADGSTAATALVADRICGDVALWGTDLRAVPGFLDAVTEDLIRIQRDGVIAALDAHLSEVAV
jgi:mannitol-1-phosphate/altronate dehydrogenase